MAANLECPYEDDGLLAIGSQIIGQHLFLGASVTSFSSTGGWGGNSSSLTVELVNDTASCFPESILGNPNQEPIFRWQNNFDIINHYYNCVGNSCYMDEYGLIFDPNRSSNPSKEKYVPGKVIHILNDQGLFSRYWTYPDPGFFGQATRIAPDGSIDNGLRTNNIYRYDLIDVPVYFRFGYFTFGGFITNWESNSRTSSPSYTVTISSPESILRNCKVILSKYAGSVFTRLGTLGGPSNYSGRYALYSGTQKQGALANVFNVYGFLESYGFGTANANANGIPISYILDSLSVLTSSVNPQQNSYLGQLEKTFPGISNSMRSNRLGSSYHAAYSPYGRIIGKPLMTDPVDKRIPPIPAQFNLWNQGHGFGIINPELDEYGVPRTQFLLDLSEIPRPPIDVRYNGSDGVASITDIIEQACEATGRDWYATLIRKNSQNFIKIKTVNRTISVPTNTIESIVRNLEQASPAIPVISSSFGKAKNENATPRVLYIGSNQKRLYQTKSYLLGYSNTHLVYNSKTNTFVDYYRFCKSENDTSFSYGAPTINGYSLKGKFQTVTNAGSTAWTNSYKLPLAYSTRNLDLSNALNGPIMTTLFSIEQNIINTAYKGDYFNSIDQRFQDLPVGADNQGPANPVVYGNYWQAITDGICDSEWYQVESFINEKPRYIPLSLTSICPFFGYSGDQLISLHTQKGSNIYRFVRPVYLDTWAGTIVVGFRSNEGPMLSFGSLYSYYRGITNTAIGSLPSSAGIGSGGTPGTVDPDPKAPVDPSTPAQNEPISNTPNPFLSNPYNNYNLNHIGFTVTETEFRAAENGWEAYLAYCLQKMPYSKPDLFVMLVKAYKENGKLYVNPNFKGENLPGAGGLGSDAANSAPDGQADGGNHPLPNMVGNNVTRSKDLLNRNFNWSLSSEFIKDWKRITEFVQSIGSKYYGKQYLVKMPEVLSYRDKQYADLQLPVASLGISGRTRGNVPGLDIPFPLPSVDSLTSVSVGNPYGLPSADLRPVTDSEEIMLVYKGSAKIFFNYEITDEAWEEPGNSIDDSIIVGSPDYFKLCKENGTLPSIIGYNANPVKDYIAEKWCSLTALEKIEKFEKSNTPFSEHHARLIKAAESGRAEDIYRLKKFEVTTIGKMLHDCTLNTVASLDIGSTDDYVMTIGKDSGRSDAFGETTIGTPITLYSGKTLTHPQRPDGPIKVIELPDDPATPIDESKDTITIGSRVPIPTIKVYYPTSCDEGFIFMDPIQLKDPRALINAPAGGVNLYDSSMSYSTDPALTVIANSSSEDYAILHYMVNSATTDREKANLFRYLNAITVDMKWNLEGDLNAAAQPGPIELGYEILKKILLGFFSILDDNLFLIQDDNSSPKSPNHYMLAPKKANPFFAAVPLLDNVNCYGPWTNHTTIATDPYDKFAVLRRYPDQSVASVLNNSELMINNTDVQKNDDWAPWNYGGMNFLDREITNQITAKTTYQLQTEDGQIVTAGMPVFNLNGGIRIRTVESDVYVQSRQVFMNYTYDIVLPFDYYNYIYGYAGLVITNISVSVSDRNITTQYRFNTYNAKLGLYNKEITDKNKIPSKLRIEMASQAGKAVRDIQNKVISQISKILKNKSIESNESRSGSTYSSKLYGTSPAQYLVGSASYTIPLMGLPYCGDPGLASEYKALSDGVSDLKTESMYLHTIARTKNWVGAFEPRESLVELQSQYASKSLMSFDGIFSPVSFYPSYNLGTYPISSRVITSDLKSKNIVCPMCDNKGVIGFFKGKAKTEIIHPCPMCNRPVLDVPEPTLKDSTDPADINFKTLNPIIMPFGEFQNNNSQLKTNPYERSRHNISVIGRQENPIDGRVSLNTNNNLTLIVDKNNSMTNYDYAERDGSVPAASRPNMHNPDFYEFDLDHGNENGNILLNQRFFAFRGPLMLHGWGYDTDGFPVPNQADEPKEFDSQGRPLRFVLTSSGTNDYKKEPKYLPGPDERLGDIFGKGYVKVSGEWVRKPVNTFHLNWGERSDLWPIGPVDLRWDRKRKVWAGGGFIGGGGGSIRIGRFMNQWPSLGNVTEPMNCVKDVQLYNPVKECPDQEMSQYSDNNFCGWILEPETAINSSGVAVPVTVKVMNILANVAAAEYQAKWCMITENNGYYYLLGAEC